MQQHAEGVPVRGWRRGPAQHLLGRHVKGRARHHRRCPAALHHGRREPEVQQDDAAGARHAHVRRLHVPVREPEGVEGTQRDGDVPQVPEGGAGGTLDRRVEVVAVEQLHREEPHASLAPERFEVHQVGVMNSGEEAKLPLEPREPRGVGGVEDLDRHRPTRLGLGGLEDRAEATGSDPLAEHVAAERAAGADRDPRLRRCELPQPALGPLGVVLSPVPGRVAVGPLLVAHRSPLDEPGASPSSAACDRRRRTRTPKR